MESQTVTPSKDVATPSRMNSRKYVPRTQVGGNIRTMMEWPLDLKQWHLNQVPPLRIQDQDRVSLPHVFKVPKTEAELEQEKQKRKKGKWIGKV